MSKFALLSCLVIVFSALATKQADAEPGQHLAGESPDAAAAQNDVQRSESDTKRGARVTSADRTLQGDVASNQSDTRAPRVVTIVVAGDTGFGSSNAPVHPTAAVRHGTRVPFDQMTSGVRDLIDGDINFANLETVITERNDLRPMSKAFNFRSHPNGVRHLVDIGFNLFSLANNHAVDYGRAGMASTLSAMAELPRDKVLASAGLGQNRSDALAPRTFEVNGARFAFGAIGIGNGGISPTETAAGQLSYRRDEDFRDLISQLSSEDGTYRILSVHTGIERDVHPMRSDVERLRIIAAKENGVDLVIGHHAHVVQGIEFVEDKLIFYGLGNFMHPGMANMGRFGRCRDYGLVARVHLISETPEEPLKIAAIEALPITEMHAGPKLMGPGEARTRIAVLNGLAQRLDDEITGAIGVRFRVRADGTGLHCTQHADRLPGAVGSACRNLQPATEVPIVACGRTALPVVSRRLTRARKVRSRAQSSRSSPSRSSDRWRQRAFGH